MTIDVNKQKGLIQTSWYDDHKGEVHIKVQIIVWGTHFHVDAWQKVGLVFKDIRKTEWSQWTERKIQENIEKLLTT